MKKIKYDKLSKEEQDLLLCAKDAAGHYFNPKGTRYVGAALKTSDGTIFQGAAIRRLSTSSNTCGERMAIDQALFAGKSDYALLAIIGLNKDGSSNEPFFSCGPCRQIILEYYPDAKVNSIIVSNSDMSDIVKTDIHELLPVAYL
ncbi:MAG: hypothetical protein Q8P83_01320 [bacterium]|nr:hypothetical protein [bacterium]